jgi:8-oxo-dGTP pyrophosphatase MutT (NUDIX family)
MVSTVSEGYGEPRAFALVVRNGTHLLVFDHPSAGVQLPKGRIEEGESSAAAARRELLEESGLDLAPDRELGAIDHRFPHYETGELIDEVWHVWLFTAPVTVPNGWRHEAVEEGMVLSYRWVVIGDASGLIHPYQREVVELLAASDVGASNADGESRSGIDRTN